MKVLLYTIRLKFMLWLYSWSQQMYVSLFKQQRVAWSVTVKELGTYKNGSLGLALYNFLDNNGFSLMPKLEAHDIYHIITDTGTEIEQEIAMQYLLFGNGKRSIYMFGMVVIGTIVFPEYFRLYLFKHNQGKEFYSLSNRNFEQELSTNLKILQQQLKK